MTVFKVLIADDKLTHRRISHDGSTWLVIGKDDSNASHPVVAVSLESFEVDHFNESGEPFELTDEGYRWVA